MGKSYLIARSNMRKAKGQAAAIVVLILLTLKVGSELLFPGLWG